MTEALTLLAIFCGAYLGARIDVSLREIGEFLAVLPAFLWDVVRGKLPSDADVAREYAKLEALYRERRE